MASIYLCSLGIGTKQSDGIYAYNPAEYKLQGRRSKKTEFVQAAEMELLGGKNFDKLIVVATEKSKNTHFSKLESQLSLQGAQNIIPLIIEEDMSPAGQWKWFEQLLQYIGVGDQLTVDLTHGYRMIPIVFSTAINFLQKSRRIELKAVYYGVFEKVRELGYAPIQDMKEFYVINEWAEAVSRLVEDADAGKISGLTQLCPEFQIGELNDREFIESLNQVTDCIRNVDVNNLAERSACAIEQIARKEEKTSITGKILLELMKEKFAPLTFGVPASGRYDRNYFRTQIEVIRLLLEHKLFMQAFTAMRELIGSIGMIGIPKARVNNHEGRKKRFRYADHFVNMFQYDEGKWNFGLQAAEREGREATKQDEDFENLKPLYGRLKSIGAEAILRSFTSEMIDFRNGFDHAWTQKSGALPEIESKGYKYHSQLGKVITLLETNDILII